MRQVLAIVVMSLLACGDSEDPACRVGADCASGVCLGDGTCAPTGTTSSDGGDGSEVADAGAETTTTDETTGDTTGAQIDADVTVGDEGEITPGVCAPIDDGRVDRAEVPLRAGLYATFRIATDVEVDLAGAGGDERAWDLEGPYEGDADARVDLVEPTGAWWATSFEGATYAARLSAAQDYLGVFEITDDALLLRGVVSPEDGVFATRLTYDPPVSVLRFPLALGDAWTSDSVVTGLTLGVPSFATEGYACQVDAAGSLATPFGTFDVLRVRTTLTRTVGIAVTTIRQMAFVAPCFGTVALVVSGPGETEAEFTEAAELRRLAP